jgi:hypothetical protein
MSQARSLEIYNLDLDSKKLLRSLTRTAAAEYNECASGGCSHVTTGVPAGWEFVGARGRLRVLSKLEHSAGLARYTIHQLKSVCGYKMCPIRD